MLRLKENNTQQKFYYKTAKYRNKIKEEHKSGVHSWITNQ